MCIRDRLRTNFERAAQRLREKELDLDEKIKSASEQMRSESAYVASSMQEREQLRASKLKAQAREDELGKKAHSMTELMGVPSFQTIEPHLDRMRPFTAEVEPLSFIVSNFIAGPALEVAPTFEARSVSYTHLTLPTKRIV